MSANPVVALRSGASRRPVEAVRRWSGRRGAEGLSTGAVERDPTVVATERPASDPGHLAERTQLVEQPRLVARDPCRQDVPFQDRGRDGDARQLIDDLRE